MKVFSTRSCISNLIFGVFASLFLFSATTDGATLHAILVGDTLEGPCSLSTECSIDRMHRQIQRIAAYTGLSLDLAIYEGYHATLNNTLQHIANMKVAEDDVVIVYFIVHGNRTIDKESKWPYLLFPRDVTHPDFGQFVELVKAKYPKLSLLMAESCNLYTSNDDDAMWEDTENEEEERYDIQDWQTLFDRFALPGPSQSYVVTHFENHLTDTIEDEKIDQYRDLFLNNKGSIVMSSSSPGEGSLRDFRLAGGLYTNKFLETLNEAIHYSFGMEGEVSWQSILENASTKVAESPEVKERQRTQGETQTPQFEIDLE